MHSSVIYILLEIPLSSIGGESGIQTNNSGGKAHLLGYSASANLDTQLMQLKHCDEE